MMTTWLSCFIRIVLLPPTSVVVFVMIGWADGVWITCFSQASHILKAVLHLHTNSTFWPSLLLYACAGSRNNAFFIIHRVKFGKFCIFTMSEKELHILDMCSMMMNTFITNIFILGRFICAKQWLSWMISCLQSTNISWSRPIPNGSFWSDELLRKRRLSKS